MESPSLRFGHVTEYDPLRHMARVHFPDLDLTSYWLPILTHNTLKNHDETHLDIGEHVACMMSGDGAEMGVVLGAFYDDKNIPQVQDPDSRAVTFSDGVRVMYDRSSHELVINSPELVSVSGNRIVLSADNAAMQAEDIAISATNTNINAQTLGISAQSFTLAGGAAGTAGITGKTVRMKGEYITMDGDNITLTGNITLDGNITLSGNVSCPGWCVDR